MPGKRCIPSQRQITLAQRTVGSPQAPHGRFQRFDFFGGFFEPLQVAQKQALIGTKPRPSRYEVMVKSAFTSSSLLADFLRKGRMRGLTRYSKRAEARQLRGPHLSLELASAFTASFRSSARLCEHLRAVSRRALNPQPSPRPSCWKTHRTWAKRRSQALAAPTPVAQSSHLASPRVLAVLPRTWPKRKLTTFGPLS